MDTVEVALAGRAYSIHIGQGLLARTDLLLAQLRQPKVAIVSNTTVAALYLERLTQRLRDAGVEVAQEFQIRPRQPETNRLTGRGAIRSTSTASATKSMYYSISTSGSPRESIFLR